MSPGISRYLPVSRHIPPYPAADTAKRIVHTRDGGGVSGGGGVVEAEGGGGEGEVEGGGGSGGGGGVPPGILAGIN